MNILLTVFFSVLLLIFQPINLIAALETFDNKQNDFSLLTKTAIESAIQAGSILKEGLEADFQIYEKEGVQNYVTEFDRNAEKAITDLIKSRFPDHAFLGEEFGESGPSDSSIVWIIDPLDGTRNYANHLKIFSISIAATLKGEVVTGVIYLPMQEELFVAEIGKGAYSNGNLLKASKQDKLEKSFLSSGFPYNIDKDPLQCIRIFVQMIQTGAQVRDLGSAAIHLAYVAAGKFDGFWHAELQPWDYAAGKLMLSAWHRFMPLN